MSIKPIRTEDDYYAALAQASFWFDNEAVSDAAEGDAFGGAVDADRSL